MPLNINEAKSGILKTGTLWNTKNNKTRPAKKENM